MATKRWVRLQVGSFAGLLVVALSLLVLSTETPSPADESAKAALPVDLAKIPSDGFFLASARIADLWKSDASKSIRQQFEKMTDEGLRAFEKQFGLSLDQIERMTLVILALPPVREAPLVFIRTTKPYEQAKVIAAQNGDEQSYKGQKLFVGDHDWAIYPLDGQSLVYGAVATIHGLIDHPAPKTEGNLADARQLAAGKHSAVVAVNVKTFNDAVGEGLPGEMDPFKPLFQARYGTLTMDVGHEMRAKVKLTFESDKDAKAALTSASNGLNLARVGLERGVAELSKEKDLSQFVALLKEVQESLKATKVEQEGKTLQASAQLKVDVANLGAVLVPVLQKIRASAARAQSSNNLKQIGLAMHNYADTNQRMPPHATYDTNGKPLLSWRVLILPYLAQEDLYKEFHLNEPWDSEHNKKLLAKMPKTYASPQDEKSIKEHLTHYQGFVGKGAFFEGKQGLLFPAEFPDGTSNTFMIVEATKAVPWTKPEDLLYDPAKPLPKLGLPGADGFLAAICDGSVRFCSHKTAEKTLRLVIERNDGMPIPADF
jgi:hypothetical protein